MGIGLEHPNNYSGKNFTYYSASKAQKEKEEDLNRELEEDEVPNCYKYRHIDRTNTDEDTSSNADNNENTTINE